LGYRLLTNVEELGQPLTATAYDETAPPRTIGWMLILGGALLAAILSVLLVVLRRLAD
jgi:hypothetical protein